MCVLMPRRTAASCHMPNVMRPSSIEVAASYFDPRLVSAKLAELLRNGVRDCHTRGKTARASPRRTFASATGRDWKRQRAACGRGERTSRRQPKTAPNRDRLPRTPAVRTPGGSLCPRQAATETRSATGPHLCSNSRSRCAASCQR